MTDMDPDLGTTLRRYESCIAALHTETGRIPGLDTALFADFEDWERQLTLKLAPHLGGEGCLIVVVAGGTNSGKSTVFNALLGHPVSPVSDFGAYTKRPLAAANALRFRQCLDGGKLLPEEFLPEALEADAAQRVADAAQDPRTVFLACDEALPDRLVLLDTPDVDSIVRENWELAKNLREAGDVVVAVLTDQKYADERVIAFLREAAAAGRWVIPLMNKAEDAARDYAVTRRQLDQFRRYLAEDGADIPSTPSFVVPRLPYEDRPNPPKPAALENGPPLLEYLMSLDPIVLKTAIFAANLRRFAQQADDFQLRAGAWAEALQDCLALFEKMARDASKKYDPKPGREMLTVVHDFIQQRGGSLERALGKTTSAVFRFPGWVYKKARSALAANIEERVSEQDFAAKEREAVERIANTTYGECLDAAVDRLQTRMPEIGAYIEARLLAIDFKAAARAVAADTLKTETYLGAYRDYAFRDLEAKWADRRFRSRVLLLYRLGLYGSWAGVVVVLSVGGWAPGLALSEALALVGLPVFQAAVTRAATYLWGDRLSGLLDKWRTLQRDALDAALRKCVIEPALGSLPGAAATLAESAATLKELNERCRNAC